MRVSSLVLALALFSQYAAAQPSFNGPREDDSSMTAWRESIHKKNVNIGITDIEELPLASDELVIRIYTWTEIAGGNGYPMHLRELRVSDDDLALVQSGPCPGSPRDAQGDPKVLWDEMQRQDFFDIRDSRSFPDYTAGLDGVTHIVQIRSLTAFREFQVPNPEFYESDDNRRLLSVLRVAAEVLGPVSCFE